MNTVSAAVCWEYVLNGRDLTAVIQIQQQLLVLHCFDGAIIFLKNLLAINLATFLTTVCYFL